MEDFSKAAFVRFLDMIIAKGIVNANTGGGWKAACNKVLEDLDPSEDVRQVDVRAAVVRYNNRHPGELSPTSLRQYEIRTATAIKHFASYVANPAGFRLAGKAINAKGEKAEPGRRADRKASTSETSRQQGETLPSTQIKGTATEQSLAIPFPLRPNFLAQLVIPRDLTKEEAKRLGAFIDALAQEKP